MGFEGIIQIGDISPSDLPSAGNKDLVSSLGDGTFGPRTGVPGVGYRSGEPTVVLGLLEEPVARVWVLEPGRRVALNFGHPDGFGSSSVVGGMGSCRYSIQAW